MILHLIANSLASIEIIPAAWCIVLLIGFENKWVCIIDIITLFLILVFETIITGLELDKALRTFFVKFVNISSLTFFVSVICLVKWKITRKRIN